MTDVHVGYVLKRFPRLSETFVAAELLELQRQGQPVTVFAVSRPNEAVQHGFLDELHVRVVYLPYRPLGEPLRTARAEGPNYGGEGYGARRPEDFHRARYVAREDRGRGEHMTLRSGAQSLL